MPSSRTANPAVTWTSTRPDGCSETGRSRGNTRSAPRAASPGLRGALTVERLETGACASGSLPAIVDTCGKTGAIGNVSGGSEGTGAARGCPGIRGRGGEVGGGVDRDGAARGVHLGEAAGHAVVAAALEGVARALVVAEALEREPEVGPRPAVPGVVLDHLLELEARLRGLPGLEVREREVDSRLDRVGVLAG